MTERLTQMQQRAEPRVEVRPLLRNVYLWMTFGLLVTALSAYLTANIPGLRDLLTHSLLVWGVFIVQLILVGILAAAVTKLSMGAAVAIFLAYAASNGFTLSLILTYYDLGTISVAFASAAALFAAMSIVGLFTKANLAKLGTYLFIGLIGLLLALLINFFLRSSTFDLIISIVGVLIFTGLTAYDTQRIAQLAANPDIQGQGSELMNKLSILGALTLYLDFLNLFLYLLRLIGRRQ